RKQSRLKSAATSFPQYLVHRFQGVMSMPLSREEVLHVALLARLELDEAEIERYTWELNRILEHIEKLKELDTEGVEPTSHAVPLFNVFRPDEPREPMPREEVLMNAPDAVDGYFRVPRVVEES
ncbi:MAG: hypothetical protein IMHGJWDQ_001437, partial [Candidatus Fervidibacter sp.]